MAVRWGWMIVAWGGAIACTKGDSAPYTPLDDADADTDTDADSDSDTDTDSDADTDTDSDADTDADSDSDTDADSDADTDTDPGDTDTDTGGVASATAETGAGACGQAPPELLTVSVENTSLPQVEVALTFHLAVSDPDGDLTEVAVRGWYDAQIDGSVDTLPPPPLEATASLGGQACGEFGADLDARLVIDGVDPDFSTEIEWAWQVDDAAGNPSNTLQIVATTPTAEGEDVAP